jgi:hypothetical protein
MNRERDYALAVDDDGQISLHRANCPHVRRLAEAGEPVMTMYDCAQEPGPQLRRHSCLETRPKPPQTSQ